MLKVELEVTPFKHSSGEFKNNGGIWAVELLNLSKLSKKSKLIGWWGRQERK